MKRKFLKIFACCIATVISMSHITFAQNEAYQYYVSPDGNDYADGSITSPFRTIERARSKIRNLREQGIDDEASIILREGEYFRFKNLKLTDKDYNMNISAYNDEKVVLTGGVRISTDKIESAAGSWVYDVIIDEDAKTNIMVADISDIYHYIDIPQLDDCENVRLFGNGKPYEFSKYPDKKADALKITSYSGTTALYEDATNRQLLWSDKSLNDMYVYGHLSRIWYIDFVKIDTFDKNAKSFTINELREEYIPDESAVLFCNIPEEINSPGECYIDREDKKIYFYPFEEETEELILSAAKEAFVVADNSRNIKFNNINFEYVRNKVFDVENSTEISFNNCGFRHFTQMNVLDGNSNKLINCTFYDATNGGVSLTGGDTSTLAGGGGVIDGCIFDSLSCLEPSYAPAVSLEGYNHTLKNSELKNSDHNLLQVGGVDLVVESNEIHHGVQWAADMGAVYYGRTPVTVGLEFKNNVFHDNISEFGETHSIYWDDRSVGPYIHDNIFYETDREMADKTGYTALKSNAGVYSTVKSNTFVNVRPMKNIDFNYELNQHVVFWLLCNSKPTLITDDPSFQNWWDRIVEAGYFGAWQEHFVGTEWEEYINMLSDETHQEVDNITDVDALVEVAKKYAPEYGVNKFCDNIIFGSDEADEDYIEMTQYNTAEYNYFTNNSQIFNDYDNCDFTLSDDVWSIIANERENGAAFDAYISVDTNENVVKIRGAVIKDTDEDRKYLTCKIYSGDEVVFIGQNFINIGEKFEIDCGVDKVEDISVILKCDGSEFVFDN